MNTQQFTSPGMSEEKYMQSFFLIYLHMKKKYERQATSNFKEVQLHVLLHIFHSSRGMKSLKSTGKHYCDVWHLNIPAGNVAGSFHNMSLSRMLKYSFFVKDKFIDVLQPFVISGFTFTSIKIIHYFSCVMKISLFPASFTKIKSHFLTSPSAKLSSATHAISFLLTSTYHHYSILHMESLRAPLQSCQQ